MTQTLILRPIQVDIVNKVRNAFKKHKKVILQAATASGKTAISAKIIQMCVANNKKCLFIADRIVLVLQTSKEFSRWGIHHGIIMADNPEYYPDRMVQIASAATIKNRDIDNFDMIIVDEAHTITKGSLKAFDENPHAFVLGLTASPYTKGLGKIYDTYIQPYTVKQLIDKKLLVDYVVYGPNPIDLSKVRVVAGEYRKDDLGKAVKNSKLTADIVVSYSKYAHGKKAICFATNVAHGRALEKEFLSRGINAREINAYLPQSGLYSANKIIDAFKNNEITVLISVSIIVKGFNAPDVDVCILATATKSMTKLTQTVGRVLRLSPGKEKAIIIDHGTNFERLGFPDEFEFDELDDGTRTQSLKKQIDQNKKLPKKCASCDFVKPAGINKCPACGYKPVFVKEIETNEGKLINIKRRKCEDITIEYKQSWLNQLNQYAYEKGFKMGKGGVFGWSIYGFKEKFKEEPYGLKSWILKEPVGKEVINYIKYMTIKRVKSNDNIKREAIK